MDLISKKELLQLTGISYGQLYRWKRERLIPEEWFIKQSSFTGQETFLPRDLILPRIRSILENKDNKIIEERNTENQLIGVSVIHKNTILLLSATHWRSRSRSVMAISPPSA